MHLNDTTNKSLRKSPEDRFWAKVNKTDTCWLWTGNICRGYGYFYYQGKHRIAHRVSWEWAYGDIPSGIDVCHSCDVPNCVRPDHLWLGTATDNMRDMVKKGRFVGMTGRKRSPEHNEKIRQLHIGRKRSASTCEKIREKATGRKPPPHVAVITSLRFKGKPLSEEHRKKISKALTGITRSAETRAKVSASKKAKAKEMK